jgi:type III pantothenate kinase
VVDVEKVLLVDAGSTRMKWLLRAGQESARDSLVHRREMASAVDSLPDADRVVVASVLGESLEKELLRVLADRYGRKPDIVTATRSCCGVTSAYTDPAQLGVDRLLGMAAGWNRVKGACLVVDCGTAVTLDMVDQDGQHLGGQLIPGLRLMVDSLVAGTRLAVTPTLPEQVWGDDTAACVSSGVFRSIAALIDRMAEECPGAERGAARVLMTGGDAPAVASLLRAPLRICPDLVLEGLACWAGLEDA